MELKGQRDINLVDICLLRRKVELSETLIFHIFEQVVLKQAIYDCILEWRVVFILIVEASNVFRVKKTVGKRRGGWCRRM